MLFSMLEFPIFFSDEGVGGVEWIHVLGSVGRRFAFATWYLACVAWLGERESEGLLTCFDALA